MNRPVGIVGVVAIALAVIAVPASPAHADSVDTLVKQLEDSSDRVRLQAATSLSRSGDKRAILPFIKRLDVGVEGDKLVRQAAASALGSLINKSTPNSIKNLA